MRSRAGLCLRSNEDEVAFIPRPVGSGYAGRTTDAV
jgi:hypothetical protein